MRSACARVARTAGPFEPFRMRKWMPASSAASAIAPPSASISLTRCPLPMPPIDGLQLIWPRVSSECVRSRVAAPMRAAASAASAPAWPPPTTMTSNCLGKCMRPLRGGPIVFFPRLSGRRGVAQHLGVLDAVLEVGRTDSDEAEVLVEALEARLRRDADRSARPDLGRAGDRPRHQFPAEADPTPGADRDHPADRRLAILRARIKHPGIGERLALRRRPRRQVPRRLVEAVDIEIDALLLDRKDELPGCVDVLQLAHAEVVEATPAPGEVGGGVHFSAA